MSFDGTASSQLITHLEHFDSIEIAAAGTKIDPNKETLSKNLELIIIILGDLALVVVSTEQ